MVFTTHFRLKIFSQTLDSTSTSRRVSYRQYCSDTNLWRPDPTVIQWCCVSPVKRYNRRLRVYQSPAKTFGRRCWVHLTPDNATPRLMPQHRHNYQSIIVRSRLVEQLAHHRLYDTRITYSSTLIQRKIAIDNLMSQTQHYIQRKQSRLF